MADEIKAIIFDVGGVLFRANKDVHTYMSTNLNIRRAIWSKKIEPEYSLAVKGIISKEKTLKNISKKLGIPRERLEKVWTNCYKRYKKDILLINLTKKLKKRYKIAILSDQWQLAKEIFRQVGFHNHFNQAIFSCDVGTRKPELRIYKIALKKLKLKPQECVFIDNLEKNLRPAKKLGMKTILFEDINQLKKDLKKKGIKK